MNGQIKKTSQRPKNLENCTFLHIDYGYFASSLSLQAARECQSKEKLLEQGFRSAFREFQKWLVNAKINTAKCFDVPQNLGEASASLQKIQVWNPTFKTLTLRELQVPSPM